MGKINQLYNPVNHSIAQCDQGVYTSSRQPSKKQLKKVAIIHLSMPLQQLDIQNNQPQKYPLPTYG